MYFLKCSQNREPAVHTWEIMDNNFLTYGTTTVEMGSSTHFAGPSREAWSRLSHEETRSCSNGERDCRGSHSYIYRPFRAQVIEDDVILIPKLLRWHHRTDGTFLFTWSLGEKLQGAFSSLICANAFERPLYSKRLMRLNIDISQFVVFKKITFSLWGFGYGNPIMKLVLGSTPERRVIAFRSWNTWTFYLFIPVLVPTDIFGPIYWTEKAEPLSCFCLFDNMSLTSF